MSYRRPWKEYQAEFNRLESNSVQESLKQEKLKVAAKLSQLDKAIEKTSQELDRNKDLTTSKKRLAEIKENLEKASLENKFARSERDEAYYEYKHALHEGKTGVAEKARYDKIQSRTVELGNAEERLIKKTDKAKRVVEKLQKPLPETRERKARYWKPNWGAGT